MAAANLRTGKVLLWSSSRRTSFPANPPQTYKAIFDPDTLQSEEVLVQETSHNMFCPGTTSLADGRVLVHGGSTIGATSIFDPLAGTGGQWSRSSPLNRGRGYHSSVMTPTGSVFTIGGSWSGGVGGKYGEVWHEQIGWTPLVGLGPEILLKGTTDPEGELRADNHAWLFTAPGERIFHGGPGTVMHWFDLTGNGSATEAGTRADDEYSINATVSMYDIGKILKVGGAGSYVRETPANSRSYIIDVNGANAQTRRVDDAAYARTFANSVVLPTGEVLVLGGIPLAEPFSDTDSVMVPEIWNPQTETWRDAASIAVPRNYHSTALLLADGRVLAAGGGQCGGCTTNHPDLQIYSPHYLFDQQGNARTRPQLLSVPESADNGATVEVATQGDVDHFVLMRFSTVTHSVNTDQRRVPLQSTSAGANRHMLSIPADRGVVPPGLYMLFAMDSNNVPSVSSVIQIGTVEQPGFERPKVDGTLAVYRGGTWYIDKSNDFHWSGLESNGGGDIAGRFGDPTDTPINGIQGARIGVFRSSNRTFRFDTNDNLNFDGCGIDLCSNSFGQAGDLPVIVDGKVGVFRPRTHEWFLDSNGDLTLDCRTDRCGGSFGGGDDIPVSRNGVIGVYRPGNGYWYFDTNNNLSWDGCGTDTCVAAIGGTAGDLPFVTPNGLIGIYRPYTQSYVIDSNNNLAFDTCFTDLCTSSFGAPTDIPLILGEPSKLAVVEDTLSVFRTGTWFVDSDKDLQWDGLVANGGSDDTGRFGAPTDIPVGGLTGAGIGVYRPSNNRFYFDANGTLYFENCDIDICSASFGQRGDKPVTVNGRIAVFRPQTGEWFVDTNGDLSLNCDQDQCGGGFGAPTDIPVSRNGAIGVYRPGDGRWFFDGNNNLSWDGCGTDICVPSLGSTGDKPIVTSNGIIGVFRSNGSYVLDINNNLSFDGCTVDVCTGSFGAPTDVPVLLPPDSGLALAAALPTIQPDGISNVVSGIELNGDLSEWHAYQSFGTDPTETRDRNNPLDWVEAWAGHDSARLYIAYQNQGDVQSSWGQSLYIDTDLNDATGYQSGTAIGADILVQASEVFVYSGDGQSWSWDYLTTASGKHNGAAAEYSIDRAVLGNPSSIRLLFIGSNKAYDGGEATDLYPDDIYETNSESRYFSYNISQVDNAAPTALDQSVVVHNDSGLEITLAANDVDGDELTYTVSSEPQFGSLRGSAPNLLYVPEAGYVGSDSFSYLASDGTSDSAVATVTITVSAPVITNEAQTPIALDGDLSDWVGYESFGQDFDTDVTTGQPIDLQQAWMAHDSQHIYVAYTVAEAPIGSIGAWGFNLYIDTDSMSTTGYKYGSQIGAEFLAQGDTLYRYQGDGDSWSWDEIGYLNRKTSESSAEIQIPRSLIGSPTSVASLFVGDNISIGGTEDDLYPNEGAGTAGSGVFIYATGRLVMDDMPMTIASALPGAGPVNGALTQQRSAVNPISKPGIRVGGSGSLSLGSLLILLLSGYMRIATGKEDPATKAPGKKGGKARAKKSDRRTAVRDSEEGGEIPRAPIRPFTEIRSAGGIAIGADVTITPHRFEFLALHSTLVDQCPPPPHQLDLSLKNRGFGDGYPESPRYPAAAFRSRSR